MARTRKINLPIKEWNIVVGNYMKELRENNKYSHQHFANLIGVERSVYSRKEQGKGKFLAAEVLYLIEYVTKFGPNIQPAPSVILDHFTKLIRI